MPGREKLPGVSRLGFRLRASDKDVKRCEGQRETSKKPQKTSFEPVAQSVEQRTFNPWVGRSSRPGLII